MSLRAGATPKKLVLDVLTPVFEVYKLLDAKQKVRFEKYVFTVASGGKKFVGLGTRNRRLSEDTLNRITAQKLAPATP